ncbi:MAG: hypothetical protein KA369_05665 [Spirochaetes bacterium]|nr:hypothetical protein [Spirochaetota bacterium]
MKEKKVINKDADNQKKTDLLTFRLNPFWKKTILKIAGFEKVSVGSFIESVLRPIMDNYLTLTKILQKEQETTKYSLTFPMLIEKAINDLIDKKCREYNIIIGESNKGPTKIEEDAGE